MQSADKLTDYSWKNAHGAHVRTTIAALKEQKPYEYEQIHREGYLESFKVGERLKNCFSDEESMSLSLIKESGVFYLCMGGYQTGTTDKIGRSLRFYLVISSLNELEVRKLLVCVLSDWTACLDQIKNTLKLDSPWSFDEVRLDRLIARWINSTDMVSLCPIFPVRYLRHCVQIESALPQLVQEIKQHCFSSREGIKLVIANYLPHSRVLAQIKEEADRYLRQGNGNVQEILYDPEVKMSKAEHWKQHIKNEMSDITSLVKKIKLPLYLIMLFMLCMVFRLGMCYQSSVEGSKSSLAVKLPELSNPPPVGTPVSSATGDTFFFLDYSCKKMCLLLILRSIDHGCFFGLYASGEVMHKNDEPKKSASHYLGKKKRKAKVNKQ